MAAARTLESRFFRALNRFVEPVIRAGIGSPGIWPSGYIVIEHTGRKSGRTYRVPVAVSVWGDFLIASTVRGERSEWLKNLAAHPALRYWMLGRAREASAIVVPPGTPAPNAALVPAFLRPLLPVLSCLSSAGVGFAILVPQPESSRPSPHS